MRLFALIVAFTIPAFAADNVTPVHDSDPQMHAAITRARQTFGDFLKLKSQGPEGTSGYMVKVRFEQGQDKEHMWVSPFRPNGKGGFDGVLKSEPRYVPNLKWGQQVSFSADQVSDWGYTQGGKRIGFFTTCMLLAKDAALRKQVKDQGLDYACTP